MASRKQNKVLQILDSGKIKNISTRKCTLEIYIPQSFEDDTNFYNAAKKKFLNKTNTYSFVDDKNIEHKFNFTLLGKRKLKKLILTEKFKRKDYDCLFYFSCSFEYDLQKEKGRFILYFSFLFKNRIQAFLIALQLSYPGFIHNDEGQLLINGHLYTEVEGSLTPIRESLEFMHSKIKWPPLKVIDINKTWNYIKEEMSGFDHMSNSPIQRALNAFSYLFVDRLNDTTMTLFWALIGIEALYVKGKNNIIDQVNEKSQVFLGQLKDFKKILKTMYNFRSRLVHGDLDLPSKFIIHDDEIYQNHVFKESDAASVAILVLIATLQKMILLNKKNLNFQYKILRSN